MAVTVTRTPPLASPASPTAATGTATGDLTPGVTYYYKICATNSTGWGRNGLPTAEISAVADANGSIDLSWTAVAGALAYVIYRTPNSGDYSIVYSSTPLDPDSVMMCLRNGGSRYSNPYTTTSTSFTDLGSTTTNSSTSPTAFYLYDNQPFLPNGRGDIRISGGIDGAEANFDDIYSDAVANGYTSNFNRLYGESGYRIFECVDTLSIHNFFKDNDFTLIYWDMINTSADTDTKTFGEFLSDTTTYKNSQFILHCEVSRQVRAALYFKNTNFYGVKFIRDYGVSSVRNTGTNSGLATSGSFYIESNCKAINLLIDTDTQQTMIYDNLDFNSVDLFRNQRGMNIVRDQSLSSYTNIRLDNQSFDTTGKIGRAHV